MKQNWSKFFTQYTILLVLGSLVISGSLMYIDNKYKLTGNSDNLQEPKEITIKKTYKSNSIIHDYNDRDYNLENKNVTSSNETTSENIEKEDTGYSQAGNSLKVKTTQKASTQTRSNKKRGLNAKNPYAVEYANAIKEYTTLANEAKRLKEEKKSATGSNRYDIDNELRKMKPKEVNITNRLKSAQKKYREWEKSH